MQTMKQSLVEASVNTVIGFAVSAVLNHFIFLHYGISLTGSENSIIVLLFTTVSMIRNLLVRRVFNSFK